MTTTEILMTDPTTEAGRKYWEDRRRFEEANEELCEGCYEDPCICLPDGGYCKWTGKA